jgi:molybdate transport system substrate-binding protein
MIRVVRGTMLAAAMLLLGVLTACTSHPKGDPSSAELTVLAAASLTDAFSALASLHEESHPGSRVVLGFAGSQQLARQILDGAPADVFASSDAAHMAELVAAGLVVGQARIFATNRLAIAVEPGNPLDIRDLADLERSDVVVVLTSVHVPAGRYAARALEAAGVEAAPSSYETDVRAALAKVRLGEADAAIVYHSDIVAAAGAVEEVVIADEHNVEAAYPAGAVGTGDQPVQAAAFLELLHSPAGRAVLAEHGFAAP